MLKRLFDLTLTIPVLILLLPLFSILYVVIRLTLGTPVFFKQQRAGRHGKIFTMLKFRTMTQTRDAAGHLLPDIERLTGIGRFLRSTSLDELPELFNVLTGDMSLVGPRPLLVDYLDRYTPRQARRHEVLPGITGWAQVNGRNTLSWEERFELDVWYVENASIGLDVKILFLSIITVLRREGISHAGEATMQPFMGSADEVERTETPQ